MDPRWPASMQIKYFSWLLCFLICRPVLCTCLCFIQINFKPFACFEGQSSFPYHSYLRRTVSCLLFLSVKAKCFSSFSIFHKSPWQVFCGQIVQVYWVILSPSFILLVIFGVFAWYSRNIFMPQKVFPSEITYLRILLYNPSSLHLPQLNLFVWLKILQERCSFFRNVQHSSELID